MPDTSQRRHSFIGSLEGTYRKSVRIRFETLYRRLYPDAARILWQDRDMEYQRAGIDAMIFLDSGRVVTVDEKLRQTDYGDMLIEVWSDYEKRFPGWAVDESKRTNFIAYAIKESGEAYWIPFAKLQRACETYLQFWIDRDQGYPHIAHNLECGRTWETYNVAVPWRLVADAIGTEQERLVHPW